MAPVMRWDVTFMLLAVQVLKAVFCSTHLPSQLFKSSDSKSLHQPWSHSVFQNHIFSREHEAFVYGTGRKQVLNQSLQRVGNVFKPEVVNSNLLNYKLKRKKKVSLRSRQRLKEVVVNATFSTNKQQTSSFQEFQRKPNKLTKENFIQRLISRSKAFHRNDNKLKRSLGKRANSKVVQNFSEQSIVNSNPFRNGLHSLKQHGVRVKRQSGSGLTLEEIMGTYKNNDPPPSKDNTGSLPTPKELQVFYIKKSGTFLRISGEGKVHSVNKDQLDVFCVVHVKAIDQNENEEVTFKFQGEWTQFYLAMNSDSRLYATPNANNPDTNFIHNYLSISHDAYKSRHGSYIAFDHNGKPLNKKVRSTRNKRTHFLLLDPDKYNKNLRKNVQGNKPTFHITTTTMPSTTTPSTTELSTTNVYNVITLKDSSRTTLPPAVTSPRRKRRRKRKGCKLKKNRMKTRCRRERRRRKRLERKNKKRHKHKKHKKNSRKQRKTRSIYFYLSRNVGPLNDASKSTLNGVGVGDRTRNSESSILTNNDGFQFKSLIKNQNT